MKANIHKQKSNPQKLMFDDTTSFTLSDFLKEMQKMASGKPENGLEQKSLDVFFGGCDVASASVIDLGEIDGIPLCSQLMGKVYKKEKRPDYVDRGATALLYDESFVEDLWDSKIFLRYSAKVLEALSDYIKKACPDFADSVKMMSGNSSPSLTTYAAEMLKNYMIAAGGIEGDDRKHLYIFELFVVSSIPVIRSKTKYRKFVNWVCTPSNIPVVNKLVDKVVQDVIKNDLRSRVITIDASVPNYNMISSVKKENLMSALPSGAGDLRRLFVEILTGSYYEVSLYYDSTHNEDESENILYNKIQALENQKKTLESNLSALQKKSENQNKVITKLQSEIGKLTSVTPDKIETAETEELKARNDMLVKKYENLLVRYNQLKSDIRGGERIIADESADDTETEMSVISETNSVFDTNLPLLFVSDKYPVFEQNIRQVFPNAEFTLCNSSMDMSRFAAVVMVTTHIGHSYYRKLKDVCKKRNVPCIHSNSTNAEIIKGLLASNLR